MTEQEYKEKLSAISVEFNVKKTAIDKEFALSNGPYKIGDIIEDHYHIILIQAIDICAGGLPTCYYVGIELTKKLSPTKRQSAPYMYQANVKRKIEPK